jgi:hypothetical protein
MRLGEIAARLPWRGASASVRIRVVVAGFGAGAHLSAETSFSIRPQEGERDLEDLRLPGTMGIIYLLFAGLGMKNSLRAFTSTPSRRTFTFKR